MANKNYIQLQGNAVVAFSNLVEFTEADLPSNLMDAGNLAAEQVLNKYYNPTDGQFYDDYNFSTGIYSNK
jgi:hypothetical protein